jgi:ubiquinone/menaquinone biosynthesis C-methylase UbiE
LVEFTGERVIPGQVNDDLWSEHIARYAFAQQYVEGKRVLDCGCGAGYGTAELAQTAEHVTGIDVSEDAIEYARLNYPRPNALYLTGSCLDLPFPDQSFDILVAFEVIEHLPNARRFLDECARVLTATGLLIVSTPNKSYYAETRAESGPNPFHEHEFEAAEFVAELTRLFPHTRLLAQNRVESFVFSSGSSVTHARLDAPSTSPTDDHFFIALCAKSKLPETASFIYVPTAANLLREREQHIRLLDDQLRRTQTWLVETQDERDRLLRQYRDQKSELEASNAWAHSLNDKVKAAHQRIDQLQHELADQHAGYEAKVLELEADIAAKAQWAFDTQERLTAVRNELADCARLLETAESTVIERTLWAQQIEREREALAAKLNQVLGSRWVKAGRTIGLGPDVR